MSKFILFRPRARHIPFYQSLRYKLFPLDPIISIQAMYKFFYDLSMFIKSDVDISRLQIFKYEPPNKRKKSEEISFIFWILFNTLSTRFFIYFFFFLFAMEALQFLEN